MTRKPSGFVRFIRKVEKKGNSNDEHSFSPEAVLGRELYQRYEGLLEWIAREHDWSSYVRWVHDGRSYSERQANYKLGLSLGIVPHGDPMGMYNGDRSGTLGKAVELILSDHQGQQQDDVPSGASGERLDTCSEDSHIVWGGLLHGYYDINSDGPSAYSSRSR